LAFDWRDRRDGLGDGVGNAVERSGRRLSNETFDLGEDLFDRIEVGRIFRQEQETGASGLDGLSHRLSFVRSEIVEHGATDIAPRERLPAARGDGQATRRTADDLIGEKF
jgi:hypothetical protein